MNLLNQNLCMSGAGYLQDIVYREDQCIAQIKMCGRFDEAGFDDIWIECEITQKSHQAFLTKMLGCVQDDLAVMLVFQAEYRQVSKAHTNTHFRRPIYSVTIEAKLQSLTQCYINGERLSLCQKKAAVG